MRDLILKHKTKITVLLVVVLSFCLIASNIYSDSSIAYAQPDEPGQFQSGYAQGISISSYSIVMNTDKRVYFNVGEYRYSVLYSTDAENFTELLTTFADCMEADTLYFKLLPRDGYSIGDVLTSTGTLTAPINEIDYYTLTDVQSDCNISIPVVGIAGIPCEGKTLKAASFSMGNATLFQWQCSVAANGIYDNIGGATGDSLEIPADTFYGMYIRVVVTDHANTYYSVPVGPVGSVIDLEISNGAITIGENGIFTYYNQNRQLQSGTHFRQNYYRISGSAGDVNDGVMNVALIGEGDFNVILNNVSIYTGTTGPSGEGKCSPISTGEVTGDGKIKIFLEGENMLVNNSANPASSFAAIEKEKSQSTLIIDSWNDEHDHSVGDCTDACGSLTAIGGADSTGIGGSDGGVDSGASKNITIKGGHVTAKTQESEGAGIGAGNNKSAEGIVIYGGVIDAVGYRNGSGIGGSGGLTGTGASGEITIYGGRITAYSNMNGAGIGGGGSNTSDGGAGIVKVFGGIIECESIGGGNSNTALGGKAQVSVHGGNVNTDYIGGGNSASSTGGDAEIIINGGDVNTDNIGGGNTNLGNGGQADVRITGGKMEARSIGAGFSKANGYAAASAVILGGSVNAKIAATPTNGSTYGNQKVFLTRVTLYKEDAAQRSLGVDAIGIRNASYYLMNDVKTDVLGMLYLWIPETSEIVSGEINENEFTGSISVKAIGVLKSACIDQYYSINIACSEYYKLYTDEQCEHEFAGAVTVKSGTLVECYVKAMKYNQDDYYEIETFYSARTQETPVMNRLNPINVPTDGLYRYQISVMSDTEAVFTYKKKTDENSCMVLDIRNADVVFHEGSSPELLNISYKGYLARDFAGTFLLTSNGSTTVNTLTQVSGHSKVFIDRIVASRPGCTIHVESGTMDLTYSAGFDNQITSTQPGEPAIKVDKGGVLNIFAGTQDNSQTLTGGQGSPAIGGNGSVSIYKNMDFLDIVPGEGETVQIQAGHFTYTTAVSTGIVPYCLELYSGTLIGYHNDVLYDINALQTTGSFCACGIDYNFSSGVNIVSEGIVDGNYSITLSGATTTIVTRDGETLVQNVDYTWDNNVLTINGAEAYGNLIVTAGVSNAILFSAYDYVGTYDGAQHGINIDVIRPVSDYTIYYSTIAEITSPPISGGNTTMPVVSGVTTSPVTVYWYIDYTNIDNAYQDIYGSNTITITPGTNEWLVGLTCPSIQYGGVLYCNALSKWGTVEYEYSVNPSFETVITPPIEEGSYYIRAKVNADVNHNYPMMYSTPLRFSIETTKVYTESGRVLTRLGGNPSYSATTVANGAFTILYNLAYSPSNDNVLSLAFDPMLPEGTKITLMDISKSDHPGYFYHIVGNAGCSILKSMDIYKMGTTTPPTYSDFFSSDEVFSAQYQYCIEYPQNATDTTVQSIILKQGDQQLLPTRVTINRQAASNSSGNISIPSPLSSENEEQIHMPVRLSASGIGNKVLTVSLADSTGNIIDFPDVMKLTLNDGEKDDIKPISVRKKIAVFDLGSEDLSNINYSVLLKNVNSGTYRICANICIIKENEITYPMHGSLNSILSDPIEVIAKPSYELKVTGLVSSNPGSGGKRVVKSGIQTVLNFQLAYKAEHVVLPLSISTFVKKKEDGVYSDIPSTWLVEGLPNTIALTAGSATGTCSNIILTVPADAQPGTYRILFSMGELTTPYNIIVE